MVYIDLRIIFLEKYINIHMVGRPAEERLEAFLDWCVCVCLCGSQMIDSYITQATLSNINRIDSPHSLDVLVKCSFIIHLCVLCRVVLFLFHTVVNN